MPFLSHKSQRDVEMDIIPDVDLDEESSYGSGTEASIPPPPPPPPQKKIGIFRKGQSKTPEEIDIPRQAVLVEDDASVETLDVSFWPSYWNQWYGSEPIRSYGRGRKACAVVACLLVLCAILGLSLGVSSSNKSNDGDGSRSSTMSFSQSESGTSGNESSGTSPPTTDVTTSAPTETEAPTEDSTSCSNSVSVDEACYVFSDIIWVSFEICEPQHGDWIGIYDVSNGINFQDLGTPAMWLWTCNSQNLDACDVLNPTAADEIPFAGGLPPGDYQAFLVRRKSGGPYAAYESGPVFTMSGMC